MGIILPQGKQIIGGPLSAHNGRTVVELGQALQDNCVQLRAMLATRILNPTTLVSGL